MGNSSSKDERRQANATASQQSSTRQSPSQQQQTSADRLAASIYAVRNASARGSRHDISFLHLGRGDRDRDRDAEAAAPERPRETKQEREARRAEKERQARLKERERSMAEEHVDGGYLVTLGTYTGPEDFNKAIVRQLMIERRLAPFWKGLEDHSDSWTEAQLFAAARGLPIPAPDEVPPEMARTASQASSDHPTSETNINNLTVPITSRSQSYQSDRSASLSASHPAFSNPSGSTPPTSTTSTLFRGRAKTLASLASGKSQPADPTPQEIRLPNDNRINGQQLEVYLYKDATECPICFLYYPPYLNRTRCCDQSICSECFVQIKRPDPHAPEHEQPGQERPPEEEAEMLVSEIASCPFCVTPEFGVTYEPPPFRRGLAYAHQQNSLLHSQASAMSSSSSLTSGGGAAGRRRATSVSASSSNVVTTDKVRPDWAKKLADARANALRRSAAATALHNAAYVLGNQGDRQTRSGLIGRRRRTLFDSPGASGVSTPREGRTAISYEDFVRITNRHRQGDGNGGEANGNDIAGGRSSSRRNRVEDLEELMMMEAIRLSLEAEEERKRRDEKEAQKDAKKRAKSEKKEEKKAEKLERKRGGSASLHNAPTNDSSSSTWASTSMARSSSNLGAQQSISEGQENVPGKGKQPVHDFAGFNPLTEPSSTLNRGESSPTLIAGEPILPRGSSDNQSASPPSSPATASSRHEDSQRHLEISRANLPATGTTTPPTPATALNSAAPATTLPNPPSTLSRQLSNLSNVSNATSTASSSAGSTNGAERGATPRNGSIVDSSAGAAQQDTTTASNGGNESMFNFGSLTAMVDHDKGREGEHIERVETVVPTPRVETQSKEPTSAVAREYVPAVDGLRSRGDTGESSTSAPPVYAEHAPAATGINDEDMITPAGRKEPVHLPDSKEIGNVSILDHERIDTTMR